MNRQSKCKSVDDEKESEWQPENLKVALSLQYGQGICGSDGDADAMIDGVQQSNCSVMDVV